LLRTRPGQRAFDKALIAATLIGRAFPPVAPRGGTTKTLSCRTLSLGGSIQFTAWNPPVTTTFDLSPYAEELGRRNRPQRVFITIVAPILVAALTSALYLLLFAPGHPVRNSLGVFIFVGGLIGLLTLMLSTFRTIQSPYRLLTLSADGITFDGPAGRFHWTKKWTDGRFRLDILDRSQLPRFDANGKPRNIDFIAQPPGGRETPLSRDAVTAILGEASMRGFHVSRKLATGRSPAPRILITIRGNLKR